MSILKMSNQGIDVFHSHLDDAIRDLQNAKRNFSIGDYQQALKLLSKVSSETAGLHETLKLSTR